MTYDKSLLSGLCCKEIWLLLVAGIGFKDACQYGQNAWHWTNTVHLEMLHVSSDMAYFSLIGLT